MMAAGTACWDMSIFGLANRKKIGKLSMTTFTWSYSSSLFYGSICRTCISYHSLKKLRYKKEKVMHYAALRKVA
jgi:hypothetical protein